MRSSPQVGQHARENWLTNEPCHKVRHVGDAGAAAWSTSRRIHDNAIKDVTQLKQSQGKDILVSGSDALVRALTEHHLIDEYRLLVVPIVLGTGKRLFNDGATRSYTWPKRRQRSDFRWTLSTRPGARLSSGRPHRHSHHHEPPRHGAHARVFRRDAVNHCGEFRVRASLCLATPGGLDGLLRRIGNPRAHIHHAW